METSKTTISVDGLVWYGAERAVELLSMAKELRNFVHEGKIEHFPEGDTRNPERKKMVVTMDEPTAQKIRNEARRMEWEAKEITRQFKRK
jgi:hypothetical protein